MPSPELYEGRQTSEPLQEWGDLAKYGVGAWIDAQYYEQVGGTTTGDRVQKGGAGSTRVRTGDGQVRTTAQRNGTAVNTTGAGGIDTTTILLFGALGLAAYVLTQ